MRRLLLLSRATSKALCERHRRQKTRETYTCVSNVTFKWDNARTFKKETTHTCEVTAAAAKLQ